MSAIRRWLHERPRWMWPVAGLVVVALVAATAIALTGDGGDDTVAIEEDPATTTDIGADHDDHDDHETTAPPTTAAPTTTRPPAVTTTRPPATTDGPARPRPGGRDGDLQPDRRRIGGDQVQWEPVEGATGYRILRSSSAGGAFAVVADFDATTGTSRRSRTGSPSRLRATSPWSSTSSTGSRVRGGSRWSPTTPTGTGRRRSR